SASGKSFDTINPATGKVVASVAETDREDVDRAVAAARSAFNKGSWRNLAPRDRKVALLRLADLVEKHQEEFAVLE
ncbi:aldehyde dehydrogenase family protein, partial [Mycobacterium tuberculosis]|nr:aldehyde dehydrogenase family protein [Mycobacterium tuberculosis]